MWGLLLIHPHLDKKNKRKVETNKEFAVFYALKLTYSKRFDNPNIKTNKEIPFSANISSHMPFGNPITQFFQYIKKRTSQYKAIKHPPVLVEGQRSGICHWIEILRHPIVLTFGLGQRDAINKMQQCRPFYTWNFLTKSLEQNTMIMSLYKWKRFEQNYMNKRQVLINL